MESLFGADIVNRTRFIPPSPRTPLRRERLFAQLAESRVAVVLGGAGFGKSTLLASFLQGKPALWYSLSEAEQDPQVFLVHLFHLFHRAFPGVADRALERLSQPGGALKHGKSAVDALADSLLDVLEDHWLVLDDFHLLQGSVLDFLDGFIQQLPPSLRVAVASRRRPLLPSLSRLLLQGDAVLLDQDQLSFQETEIAELAQRFEHPLSPKELNEIEAETEGWPMGLQLYLRKGSRKGARHPLHGDRRHLFDYLAQEVFATLTGEEQTFLLDTATLPYLDPELCNALLGRTDSLRMLQSFLDRGLFVIPEGESFRHHHLFHEFLQGLLAERGDLSDSHRKTARLLLGRSRVEEAVEHLLAAGEYLEAAQTLAEIAPSLVNQARYAQFEGWLKKLPESLLDRAPALAINQGDALRLTSRFEEALQWYDRAERGYEGGEGKSRALAGKARVFLDTVQPLRAGRLLEEALNQTESPKRRAELLAMLGENKLNLGDAEGAEHCFQQAREECPEAEENQGRVLLRSGRLEAARTLLKETHHRGGSTRSHREAALVLSFIEALLGEGKSAFEEAGKALLRAREQHAAWTEAVAWMRRGHASLLLDAREEARHSYEEALKLAEKIEVPRLRAELCLGLAQLSWREGNQEAEKWAEEGWNTARETGDSWLSGLLALALGSFLAREGNPKGKRWLSLAEKALAQDPFGLTLVTLWSAQMALRLGEDARPCFLRLLERMNEYGFLLSRPTLLGFDSQEALDAFVGEGLKHGFDRRKDLRAPALKVKTFGSFKVWRDGEEIPEKAWSREKARQLFHLLVVFRGESLPKSRIIDLLWPELDPDGADGTFRVALNALNKALEPDRKSGQPSRFILRQGSNYGLSPEVLVDAAEFERLLDLSETDEQKRIERLEEALSLFEGDFLSDYPHYEAWCERERARLQDRFVAGSLKLARYLEGKAALPWLTRLIEHAPSVEEGYQLLMKQHYRGGDRALALRTFERCVENLSHELDVEVSPETERLYQRILAQADPASL